MARHLPTARLPAALYITAPAAPWRRGLPTSTSVPCLIYLCTHIRLPHLSALTTPCLYRSAAVTCRASPHVIWVLWFLMWLADSDELGSLQHPTYHTHLPTCSAPPYAAEDQILLPAQNLPPVCDYVRPINVNRRRIAPRRAADAFTVYAPATRAHFPTTSPLSHLALGVGGYTGCSSAYDTAQRDGGQPAL